MAGAHKGVWLSGLEAAAAQAGERARRLVIVVDGLDEERPGRPLQRTARMFRCFHVVPRPVSISSSLAVSVALSPVMCLLVIHCAPVSRIACRCRRSLRV